MITCAVLCEYGKYMVEVSSLAFTIKFGFIRPKFMAF